MQKANSQLRRGTEDWENLVLVPSTTAGAGTNCIGRSELAQGPSIASAETGRSICALRFHLSRSHAALLPQNRIRYPGLVNNFSDGGPRCLPNHGLRRRCAFLYSCVKLKGRSHCEVIAATANGTELVHIQFANFRHGPSPWWRSLVMSVG